MLGIAVDLVDEQFARRFDRVLDRIRDCDAFAAAETVGFNDGESGSADDSNCFVLSPGDPEITDRDSM